MATSWTPPMSMPISIVVEHESRLIDPSLKRFSYLSRSSDACCAECSAAEK
jgi:hypothetical protein